MRIESNISLRPKTAVIGTNFLGRPVHGEGVSLEYLDEGTSTWRLGAVDSRTFRRGTPSSFLIALRYGRKLMIPVIQKLLITSPKFVAAMAKGI